MRWRKCPGVDAVAWCCALTTPPSPTVGQTTQRSVDKRPRCIATKQQESSAYLAVPGGLLPVLNLVISLVEHKSHRDGRKLTDFCRRAVRSPAGKSPNRCLSTAQKHFPPGANVNLVDPRVVSGSAGRRRALVRPSHWSVYATHGTAEEAELLNTLARTGVRAVLKPYCHQAFLAAVHLSVHACLRP